MPKTKRMIAFTEPQLAYLTSEAARLGVSIPELNRRIIDQYREGARKMDPELERYAAEIGDINVAALRKGGEVLLDQVQHDLGVAYRHTDRVRRGVFTLTPQIIREIDQSLERGRKRIANAGT